MGDTGDDVAQQEGIQADEARRVSTSVSMSPANSMETVVTNRKWRETKD